MKRTQVSVPNWLLGVWDVAFTIALFVGFSYALVWISELLF